MKEQLWMLSIKIQNILSREEGQDLIEYALVVALIAFAATAGMSTVANNINIAFSNIAEAAGDQAIKPKPQWIRKRLATRSPVRYSALFLVKLLRTTQANKNEG